MRTLLAASLTILLTAGGLTACGDDGQATPETGSTPENGSGQGGPMSMQPQAGDGGATNGGAMNGGAMNGGAMNGGAMNGGAMNGGAMNGGAMNGGEPRAGVCGQRGEGTVDGASFEGFEEFYVIGDEGFGDDVCVVRVVVQRVGPGPEGCADLDGIACAWTHEITYESPEVTLDVDGACAGSDLGLDSEAISGLAGERVAYGFVSEFAGHNSVLLRHDAGTWSPHGNANWNDETGAFRFDNRTGRCSY